MKYITAISMLAMAAITAATPLNGVEARWGRGGGGGGGGSTCDNNQQQVCCASVLSLICLVDVLGGNCNGGSYCCDNGASVVSCCPSHTSRANWNTNTLAFVRAG